jgi:WD40 repeat protein
MRHDDRIYGMDRSPNKNLFVTWSEDRTARLWDAAGHPLGGLPFNHSSPLNGAFFDLTGERVLTGSQDESAVVWDIKTRRPVFAPIHAGANAFATFSQDGRYVIVSARENGCRLWSATNGLPVTPPKMPGDPFCIRSFFKDTRRAIAISGTQFGLTAIEPDSRPLDDLRRLAELLCGNRLNEFGIEEPLTPQEWQARWTELNVKYPSQFHGLHGNNGH